jgi:hypothetical protein
MDGFERSWACSSEQSDTRCRPVYTVPQCIG